MSQLVIANSLTSGLVVFLTKDNSWSEDIANAAIANNEASATALLQAAKNAEAKNQILDPYLINVRLNGAEPEPTEFREYVRAFGPGVSMPSVAD